MADNRNFAALDWLIHEISETLKEARQALEAYVENPKDSVRIRFCLTHIHQVHGSLQMVEFFGAAMLAEEMERLTQAMIQGSVANPSEAHEVLMRAILQFPVYLDQVKATRRDNPLVVLPLLNDLRAVRGESLLTDTKLFVPNLAPAKKIVGERIAAAQDNVQFQSMALKLRQMYQYAAAGFIRSVNSDENLAYLQKVFARLQKLTQGTARFALWDICMALAEALEKDAIEISVAIKNILRQLDKEIKILAVHGTKALNSYTNDELIKNLLYYVARAGKHSPGFTPNSHLQRVYETYHLDDALIEGKESGDESGSILSSPDQDALRSVVDALKTEMDFVKSGLDACLAGGDTQQSLAEILPVVKRIADTMAMLGLGDLRKQVLEQGTVLDAAYKAGGIMSHEDLMSVASKVVEIEDSLDSLSQQQAKNSNGASAGDSDINLSRAKESVLRESRNGLEHAKDAIIEYIASQWDRTHLQNVPDTLREIRGGLEIMPLPRAGRILGACARYIEEQLLPKEFTPQWSTLDTLADAITSVEYYLERLSSGANKEENELLLGVAEDSVAALGYAVAKSSRADAPAPDAELPPTRKAEEIHTTPEAAEADEASLTAAYESAMQAEVVDNSDDSYPLVETPLVEAPSIEAPSIEAPLVEAKEVAPDIIEEAEEEIIYEAPVEASVVESSEVEAAVAPAVKEPVVAEKPVAPPASKAPAPAVGEDDDDYIDEEIIEIFVEEAGEVTETIAEFFPLWAKNFEDSESLTEFRRAFHTLKGSGRMVGAHDIGELAWSIENMLNRVIDHTIEPDENHVLIIEKVRELFPNMIKAFSVHQPNPYPDLTIQYRGIAESLAKGVVPPELAQIANSGAPVPVAHTPAPVADIPVAEVDDADVDDVVDAEDVVEAEEIQLEPFGASNDEYEVVEDETPAEVSAEESARDQEEISAAFALHVNNITAKAIAPVSSNDDDNGDDADMQLWEIFSAEALTHLQTLQEFIAHMEAESPCYEPPSDGIQRALHTLKGSAHMAEITPIAELAAPLEKFVKELRSYHININEDILQLLRDAVTYTHAVIRQIEQAQVADIPRLHQFIARVNELRELHVAPIASQQELDENGKRPVDPELLAIFMAEEMNLLLDADKIIAQWQSNPHIVMLLQPVLDELRKLTRGAHHAYLLPMANLGDKLEQVYTEVIAQHLECSDALCNTLNAAHVALVDMVDATAAGQNLAGEPHHIHQALDELLAQAANAEQLHIPADYFSADEDAIAESAADDRAVTSMQVEEVAYSIPDLAVPDLDVSDLAVTELAANDESTAEPESITEIELVASDFGMESDSLEPMALEDDAVEEVEAIETIDFGDEIILEDYSEELPVAELDESDVVEDHEELIIEEPEDIDAELVAETSDDELEFEEEPEEEMLLEEEPVAEVADIEEAVEEDEELDLEEVASSAPVEHSKPAAAKHSGAAQLNDDFDPEIVEIFIEEATELLEDIERALHEWQEDWSNTDCVEELKRCLHTFKGGARLAGAMALGDLSHDFETVLIDMKDTSEIDQAFFKRLNNYQDRLHAGVAIVQAKLSGADVDESSFEAADDVASHGYDVEETSDESSSSENVETYKPTLVVDNDSRDYQTADTDPNQKPNVLTFTPKAKPAPAPVPKVPGTEFGGGLNKAGGAGGAQVQHLAARRTGPQEVVKVSAELLEELVNLAGETSISRGRMEQQVSDLGGAIEEMDSTIHRLQEQLRRLDIETEAQVLFRQEQMAQHEEFDPLEMDRYSQLQQLSRSLIESASDLMDLKFTLADKTRDTETLLLQQSRINTDLQEGLMRSRMVPFSRLVPRLRRIVRQAADELGKDVDFELDNVEGELDRTVLERMVAPLEHMLRNAVDHGIESPEGRAAAGKPATGRIVLSLGREGGDVMLRLADDGRGINLTRVREKAIERGLMAADAPLSDQDLMQFILHAGFSTADKVTQISGRGVGMDVVHSEIKQLGGAMFIDSRWGEGTEFTIRLPFTVSVNRALMVQIGDDLYAIPLNTIEGIVRVSPFELEHYYQDEDARFDYAGEHYLVRYLGSMLDNNASPKLDAQTLPLPVILLRSTENTVALQVDRLLGSREIVVKTLGVQFSAVRGVSGATVTGDGSVVVILDLHALIREQLALGLGRAMLLEPTIEAAPVEEDLVEKTVMVVDDSVTVRKVTGRFLEREGFRVISAKDGVEALQLLQDHIPDVMLLDIEMPRMDGFEVAKNIRTSSRLRDIPIIMITSRTGEKHRERAFELGVNKYMGKPYQEDLLLSNIKELIKTPVK